MIFALREIFEKNKFHLLHANYQKTQNYNIGVEEFINKDYFQVLRNGLMNIHFLLLSTWITVYYMQIAHPFYTGTHNEKEAQRQGFLSYAH